MADNIEHQDKRVSIQFPILNISLSNLSSQDLEETHIGDLWDYPGDNSIFEEYYNNQKYVVHPTFRVIV